MQELTPIFVVEYSLSQNAWHVDDLQTVLQSNREWCVQGPIGNDYKIVALVNTRDEAHAIVKQMRQFVDRTRSIQVIVGFFGPDKGGREQVPGLRNQGYRPSLRVSGKTNLLEIEFTNGPDEYDFDDEVDAHVLCFRIPHVSYKVLAPGVTFDILEGDQVVGYGTVTSTRDEIK